MASTRSMPSRIVIVGGGFGGLAAAQGLARTPVEILMIDRTNHHVFQPLLYQVATAALSPGDIAWPLRTALRGQQNLRLVMDEVETIDRTAHQVIVRNGPAIPFDTLILAPGSQPSYFGHDEWAVHAPGLKTLPDALALRERLLLAFEEADHRRMFAAPHPLTFVIVGGGPTGVELAGALAEIGRRAMAPDFPTLRWDEVRILLVEGGERLLPGFSPNLSDKATIALQRMGVTVILKSTVHDIRDSGVMVGDRFIEPASVIWAAGNRASLLVESLGSLLDGTGRVLVRPDLSIPGDPWIFVIGDAAHCRGIDDQALPGLAPVAMQQGQYVADLVRRQLEPDQRPPFAYTNRGLLATIGRAKAVAQFGSWQLSGLPAWLIWCIVHIFFLISLRNRFRVMSEWIWYYFTFKPGARLIYGGTNRRSESERSHSP
ncbi:MAG: NAD(P)/FAD-dependent oxidoreductase [Nitrospiraceae bacterium]